MRKIAHDWHHAKLKINKHPAYWSLTDDVGHALQSYCR